MQPQARVEILRAACCVAGADGNASPEERVLLQKLADRVGVGVASFDAMVERSEKDPEFYKKQFSILKAEPKEAMAALFQVAMADGKVTDEEKTVLKGLADNLGVPEDIFAQVFERSKQLAGKTAAGNEPS